MPNNPAPSVAPSTFVVKSSEPTDVVVPQQSGSGFSFQARSARTAQTRSSRSSSAVKAQKAAVEALALRRQLEREQELAAREHERERQLAALQQQVEQSELIAELAAIDADASSCAGSRLNSSRVSVDRTNKWIEHHRDHTEFTQVNEVIPVVEREQYTVPSPSPSPVIQPTAARATTSFINEHHDQSQPRNIAKASEPIGTAPPLVTSDLVQQTTLLRAVADTAAAAKALASAHGVKKLDLFPFSGDNLQWLQFKRIYDVTKNNFSALENINRLQNAVCGPAREAIAALLMSVEDPEVVMRALEDNFARPELIVFKEVSILKNLPRLGNDLKELGTLSNRVCNSIATIKLLKQIEYLYSPELFHAVLGKLNPTMKIRWTDFATLDTTGRPKLEIMCDFLRRELDQHVKFGLSPEFSSVQNLQHFTTAKQLKRENVNTVTHSKSVSNKKECTFCKKDHNIKSCSEFKVLSIDDRWQWLREAKVCYRCLRSVSHQWKTCKAPLCGIEGCPLRHHSLLHKNPPVNLVNTLDSEITHNNTSTLIKEQNVYPNSNVSVPIEEKVVVSSTSTQVKQVDTILSLRPRAYLKIIPVTVSGPAGTCDVYALLDDGSTATLIDSMVATQIGASGPKQMITVNGVGGLERKTTISYVNFSIKGRHTPETFLVKNARAIESLSLRPQTIKGETIKCFSHLSDLVDVLTYDDATPTILIGAEHWHLSINRDVRIGRRNDPVACLTALGWTLYGVASSKTKLVEFVNHGTFVESSSDDNLENIIKEQYKIDSLGISKKETLHSKQDKRAIDIVESSSRRLPTGRFEVGMPWRDDIQRVPDSYPQAMSRFLSLERRMSKDVGFASAYDTFMVNMLNKGYAEECASETYYTNLGTVKKDENIRLYLPHFGVYHPQKNKLRVVHDAAARNEGVSLNSLLLSGPDLLQPLLKILFCFREGRIGITADIKEMFPQIRVREKDRDALRYLWRSEKTQPLKEFRMRAVIFGACCSPFIAQYMKSKNALEHKRSYPKAADAILFNHYMDDYIDSLDNVDEAAKLASDIITVHSAACFEMRGWISNEPAALNLVPIDLRAPQLLEIDLVNVSNDVRALGMAWNPTNDNLGFRTGLSEAIPSPLTKRKILSHLMRVYDPLGLLGPIVVKGRILFQQAWRLNLNWDNELPQSEASKWFDWFQELSALSSLKIPRWYAKAKDYEPSVRELHVFADASELAYACVAYWRLIYADGSIELTLISSKARVSPLKPMSIPRLELQAALIASRLALTIKDSHRKKPVRTFLWTDSKTVLSWLRSDARTFKPFVAHRVGEITENSCVQDWRWVPTDLNVADDITRVKILNLNRNHRWFLGPSFLFDPPENWPIEPAGQTTVQEEHKHSFGSVTVHFVVTADPAHFSDWLRLIRATARVLQVAAKFRSILDRIRSIGASNAVGSRPRRNSTFSTSTTLLPLSAELIRAAEEQVLRRVQSECFAEEIRCIKNSLPLSKSSRLKKLSPVLGEDKLMRLAGRIRAIVNVSTDVRSPVLLDGSHPIVRSLVLHFHKKAGHANNQMVINEIRQKYWILRLRNLVRSLSSQCLFCRIRKAKPMTPMTGDLPLQRLAHHRRPFTFVGLDYFGPINVTIGRRKEKRYVALFTCMTARAIHLELVHSLTADSAIMALRRFIARRGTPETLYSDNGTCFVGANRILKDFYRPEVEDFAANRGIKWSFIPAAAPFFGGCWERLVRCVKVALNATLHERAPKEETLLTLLFEAEAIVNSRPLSHVSLESDDEETLTPFHFIIGSSSNQSVPGGLDDTDLLRRAEWRKALRLADHFWERWVKEVLPTMQPRQISGESRHDNVKVGDVVIIVDENLPRGTWPRGRVAKLFPGKDGVVRVVDVATAAGLLRRPARKLVRIAT